MAKPKKVSENEYDEVRSRMEDKYGYEDMSDEEKKDFDYQIDQVVVVGENTDETDDEEIERGERDDGHPRELNDDDENIR